MSPELYERVQRKAEEQWASLEQNGGAKAWRLLFKQIQLPRLVISELLQNADDAGAKEVLVQIENGAFIFEHDGDDFTEDQFRALCDFCSSSKKTLHTIGCWGIGFKSTFSLGDCVQLFSPSISVSFHRDCFTIPCWLQNGLNMNGKTRIVIEIQDESRRVAVEDSFQEWQKDPLPLLFFKNIRRLTINDLEIHRKSLKQGPIPESEWMRLGVGETNKDYLLIHSLRKDFSEEVINEIKDERGETMDSIEKTKLPPFKIDVVLGARGMLYTVLPTGIETELPFACNAPFIQDPARHRIKDPHMSPTNTWLLNSVGELAASAMLNWLNKKVEQTDIRARAYDLFTDVDRDNTSLEGNCGTIVEKALGEAIDNQPLLLTEEGRLVQKKTSIAFPLVLFEVWPHQDVVKLLDSEQRPALNRYISPANRKKLLNWDLVEMIDERAFLDSLKSQCPPRPKKDVSLLKLWSYVERLSARHAYYFDLNEIHVIPAQGEANLHCCNSVVRFVMEKLKNEDKELITSNLHLLDQKWADYLTLENEKVPKKNQELTLHQKDVKAAISALQKIGLSTTSSPSKVINLAAKRLFANGSISVAQSVQLAQIAAKIDASISDAFCYFTQESRLHSSKKGIYFDKDGSLIKFFPDDVEHSTMLLHNDYTKKFISCTKDEWELWVESGKGGLLTFTPLKKNTIKIHGKSKIHDEARRRLYFGNLDTHIFNTEDYIVEDWDFDKHCWDHWKLLAKSDERLWTELTTKLLRLPISCWDKSNTACFLRKSTSPKKKLLTEEQILPTWALKLRELPCLPDTNGKPSKPTDLYRLTNDTSYLKGREPFVSEQLDEGERTAFFFDLLGVKNKPPGPMQLLEILQEHSTKTNPPVSQVEGLYQILDKHLGGCTDETTIQTIKRAFQTEKIVLTQNSCWESTPHVFISPHEVDFDVEVIRKSVKYLKMWNTFEVPDRPTSSYAVGLLQKISNKRLDREEARHIRLYLKAYPVEIWQQCKHWINLEGEWDAVDELSYSLTKKHLADYNHIHTWVKQKTADLRDLSDEAINYQPFSELEPLNTAIEERIHPGMQTVGHPGDKEWITTFGAELYRIKLDTEDKTQNARVLAKRFAQTKLHYASNLKTVPYIKGECAGDSQPVKLFWSENVLYVGNNISEAKLANLIPSELGKVFEHQEIEDALRYCYERKAQDIRNYLEENFHLCKESTYLVDDEVTSAVEQDTVQKNNEIVEMESLSETEHGEKDRFLDSVDSTVGNDQPVDNNAKRSSMGNRQTKSSGSKTMSPNWNRRTGEGGLERPEQAYFREGLMAAYGGKCAISGCNVAEVLEAAHIRPVKDGGSNEVSNGLILRADLHLLFDRGLITIDSTNMKVLVHNKLLESEYGLFAGKSLWIPTDPSLLPSKELLDRHKKHSF